MGYKTELAKFFNGAWLTGPMLSDSAGATGATTVYCVYVALA
jgi:hypothetical protein